MTPEDEAAYKQQVAHELNSDAYECVSEAHILDDGRLVAFIREEYSTVTLAGRLPAYVTLNESGNNSVELGIEERWAPMHLD